MSGFEGGSTLEGEELAELRERLNRQFERLESIQTQAWRLFRLVLPTIGVLVTGITFLFSDFGLALPVPTTSQGFLEVLNRYIATTATQLPIGEAQARLILVILILGIYLGTFDGLFKVFVQVPWELYGILGPKKLEYPHKDTPNRGSSGLYGTYIDAIIENEDNLDSLYEKWLSCYEVLGRGVRHLAGAVLLAGTLLLIQHGVIVLLLLLALICYLGWFVHNVIEPDYATIRDLVFVLPKLDGSALLIFIPLFLEGLLRIPAPVSGLMMLIGIIGYSLFSYQLPTNRVAAYIIRNTGLFLISTFAYFLLSLGTSPEFQTSNRYLFSISVKIPAALTWMVLLSLLTEVLMRATETLKNLASGLRDSIMG